MPTLHWIGKEKVVNHHRDVPFRVLEPIYTFTTEQNTTDGQPSAAGNKIIHGDNLEALKALLPEYEDKVKCIYIDPPYNTGNESWVYNDNVNDPKIQRWLQQVVGKEGEDLTRHDKWLCMMYPRLKLLHKLLANDGAIFISIDDNEQANLKLVMDEVFGAGNFVANIMWQKKYTAANDHKSIAPMHDFLVVYTKSNSWIRGLFPRDEKNNRQYRLQDDKGVFRSSDYTCNKSADERPNLYYPIVNPNTGLEVWPNRNAVWRYSLERHNENVAAGLVYWGKDGRSSTPAFKRYLDSLKNGGRVVPNTWWDFEFAGHTDAAKKEIRNILADDKGSGDFITPKPTSLIKRVLQVATDKDSIILDSFAGSGTTAHAVLNLNKEDGGNRKFILVEMEDYAEGITAERVKRVMQGYGEGSKTVEGTGGSFSYYELGPCLFNEENNLNEAVGLERIRQYIWYSETRSPYPVSVTNSDAHFLGSLHSTAYYFVYEPDQITNLDYDFLATITHKAEQYVIYADNCLLPKELLQKYNIVFKKIPRDISRF